MSGFAEEAAVKGLLEAAGNCDIPEPGYGRASRLDFDELVLETLGVVHENVVSTNTSIM